MESRPLTPCPDLEWKLQEAAPLKCYERDQSPYQCPGLDKEQNRCEPKSAGCEGMRSGSHWMHAFEY